MRHRRAAALAVTPASLDKVARRPETAATKLWAHPMIKHLFAACVGLALAGCAGYPTGQQPNRAPPPVGAPPATAPLPQGRISDFSRAATRIEATAQSMCRDSVPTAPAVRCDFEYRLVDDPRLGPNAFQTLGPDGRPVVAMTTQLVAATANSDEIAFILGHESAHHISDHLGRAQSQAMTGALVLGALATLGNASDDVVSDMMDLGAALGGRAYSQSYELEADRLGAYIAARAGYDPGRGALVFARPVLAGGGGLLSTHPGSAQRQTAAAATAAEIRRQQAQGLTPDPRQAGRAPGAAWF